MSRTSNNPRTSIVSMRVSPDEHDLLHELMKKYRYQYISDALRHLFERGVVGEVKG